MSKPVSRQDFPNASYPITITVYSRTGVELWSRTVERPAPGELVRLDIPGYGGTEHVPVTVRTVFADGQVYVDDRLVSQVKPS